MFRERSANDPTIVGKMVYDPDSYYPLGILQLAYRHPESGCWITVKVDGPEEIQILHRDQVLIWEPGGTDEDEDHFGANIIGNPSSQEHRVAGEAAGASWRDRPGYDDTGDLNSDDPNVYSTEAEVEATHQAVDRPWRSEDRIDPVTGQQYTLIPAGGPLGRSQGMALDRVKILLAQAGEALKGVALGVARIAHDFGDHDTHLRGVYEGLRGDLGVVLSAVNELQEQRTRIIVATSGHQVPAPAEALGIIDAAIAEAEKLAANIRQMQERVNEARAGVSRATDLAGLVTMHSNRADSILARYRTSF